MVVIVCCFVCREGVVVVVIVCCFVCREGVVVVVIVWGLGLPLPGQSVPFTTKVASSNPVHEEVYSIQHYVIKFVSYVRQVGGFLHQ